MMTMIKVRMLLERIRNREEGVTAVEYAMIAALIAAVIVGVVALLGTKSNNAFQTISDAMP